MRRCWSDYGAVDCRVETTCRHPLLSISARLATTRFFEAGAKRRLTDEEVRDLDWRDCTFNVLLRISSCWLQGSGFGPVATPEAIVVSQSGGFPDTLDFEGSSAIMCEF